MVLAILWCTDAFAHGDGKCNSQGYRIAHFEPYTDNDNLPSNGLHADPSGMNARTQKLFEDGHGHINYADINGNGVYDSGDCKHSWGYWVAGGYARVVNGGNMEEEFVDCGRYGLVGLQRQQWQ